MATTKAYTQAPTTTTPVAKSPGNVTGDPTQNLQSFNLVDLQQYTMEQQYAANASKDFHLFYVGRDDVHDILKYVLSRVNVSLYLNMFGFDDDELNNIIWTKIMDPNITVVITLDKSQAGGKHEAALLAQDQKQSLSEFNTHFVVGQSATHQISHTKGFVADGKVGAEGSTNWSDSGEGTLVKGTFMVKGDRPSGPGYKAQNNTQTIFIDQDSVVRFTTELIAEHLSARSTPNATKNKPTSATPKSTAPVAPVAKKAPAKKAAPVASKAAAATKKAAAPKTPAKKAPAKKAKA